MGLEDFKSDNGNSVGSVSTRKKIKNVKIDKQSWKRILYHHPSFAETIVSGTDEQGVKAIVELMDKIIQQEEDVEGWSENQAEEVERVRNNIVSWHLEDR